MTVIPVSSGELSGGAGLGNVFIKPCYLLAPVLPFHLHSSLTFLILLMELRPKEVK